MNGFTKMLNKMTTTHVVTLLAVLALGYAMVQYSGQKSLMKDGMNGAPVASSGGGGGGIAQFPQPSAGKSCVDNVPVQGSGPVGASEFIGESPEYASAKGLGTSTHGMPSSCQRSQVIDPKELMPKGESEWSKLNPMGGGEFSGQANLLSVPSQYGLQTKGSSLRNANMQLRPDPVIPKVNTGPFLQSTITHDNRPGFELNC